MAASRTYQWLTFFEHDDAKLQHIHDEYALALDPDPEP